MEKNLIIVRGIPGSGKTTFAEMICKIVFSADDYHTDKDGNYNWKPENVGKAHEWCQAQTAKAMERGVSKICVANTSTTEREMRPYRRLAQKFGYKVFSIVVENRHGGNNTHDVPAETLTKMTNRFEIKL